MGDRNRLFISYSHKDTKWLTAVTEQLKVLETEGLVSLCEDSQLEVGEDWYQQLNDLMSSARLGLLLVSATFLTSKFVLKDEVPRLIERHGEGGMKIYPLLVEPCPWKRVAWLARLQLRPQDANRETRALSTFRGASRKQKIVDVADEIASLVKP